MYIHILCVCLVSIPTKKKMYSYYTCILKGTQLNFFPIS